MPHTVLAAAGLALHRALQARGVDADALYARAGFDTHQFATPGARVRAAAFLRAWALAEAETGDPYIGLTVWPHLHPASAYVLGYAWLASPTLKSGMRRLVRYQRIISDLVEVALNDVPEGYELECRIHDAPGQGVPAPMHESFLAGVLAFARVSFGEGFAPLQVRLARPAPPARDRYDRLFRCPVEFDAPLTSMLCRRDDLERPLPTGNAELALANDRVVAEYAARLDRDDIVAQVRRRLLEALPSGTPNEAEIAQALSMSPRTLQRRLAEKDTSFSDVLDSTRRELALEHLSDPRAYVTNVAFMLGFAEVASFNRAFRRWTGTTPTAHRASTSAALG